MMKRQVFQRFGGLILFFAVLILTACSSESGATEGKDGKEDKPKIVTTIAQIGEPLSVIGGDLVDVESLMGPSVDPHLYNATQSDIKKVSEADIIFYNGLNLEANMVEIFNEMAHEKVVLAIGEAVDETALLTDEDGAIDPHIWFDLQLWEQALDAAVEKMKEFSPEHAETFEKNKIAYFKEMDQLAKDAEKLQKIPEEKRILVTAHDAFGYFGRMHQMEVVGLQGLSTDAEIGVTDITNTIELIKEHQVPAIFVESSINDSSIKAVIEGAENDGIPVELGGELFSDAMGQPGTEEGTYLGMYRHNVQTIFDALSGGE